MCPDKELISAYYDGETDIRWSDEIISHVEGCKNCSKELGRLDRISTFFQDCRIQDESEIKERVYNSVIRKRKVICTQSIWKRHFDVSFPMIVSAAALFVILTAVLFFGIQFLDNQNEYVVEEIQDENPQIRAQVISIEDAAAYLLSDDSGFDVLITIPTGDGLSLTGEPQLIREADYKRGQ